MAALAASVTPASAALPASALVGPLLGLPPGGSQPGVLANPLAIVPNTIQDVLGSPAPLTFPADDSAHTGHMIEDWQWWLRLQTPDGRRFSATIVFFDFPLTSALGAAGVGIRRTDVRLTDLSDGSVHSASTYSTDPLTAVPNGFDLAAAGQTATGGNGDQTLHIAIDGYALDVTATTSRAPVPLVNPEGYVRLDPLEVARIYNRWRMDTTGTVQKNGQTMHVTGATSFEHIWGTIPPTIQWDAFYLHLNDGRDMQIAQVRRAPGTPNFLYTGTIRDQQGNVRYLQQGDFTIAPTGTWRRDATCAYPSGWKIRVSGDQFTVVPSVINQEVRSLYGSYWDGDTTVTGGPGGDGVADLLNYCQVP